MYRIVVFFLVFGLFFLFFGCGVDSPINPSKDQMATFIWSPQNPALDVTGVARVTFDASASYQGKVLEWSTPIGKESMDRSLVVFRWSIYKDSGNVIQGDNVVLLITKVPQLVYDFKDWGDFYVELELIDSNKVRSNNNVPYMGDAWAFKKITIAKGAYTGPKPVTINIDFSCQPQKPIVGQPAILTISIPAGFQINTVKWEIDGAFFSNSPSCTPIFWQAGKKSITVTVVGIDGSTGQCQGIVEVLPIPATATIIQKNCLLRLESVITGFKGEAIRTVEAVTGGAGQTTLIRFVLSIEGMGSNVAIFGAGIKFDPNYLSFRWGEWMAVKDRAGNTIGNWSGETICDNVFGTLSIKASTNVQTASDRRGIVTLVFECKQKTPLGRSTTISFPPISGINVIYFNDTGKQEVVIVTDTPEAEAIIR